MKPPQTLSSHQRTDPSSRRHEHVKKDAQGQPIFPINKSSRVSRKAASSDSIDPPGCSVGIMSDMQKKELAKKAQMPWGTRLIHWARLFSPLEWYKFAQFRRMPVDWRAFFDAVCGIVIPFLVYYPACLLLTSPAGSASSSLVSQSGAPVSNAVSNLVLPYLCSPWVLHCLRCGSKPFVQLTNAAKIRKSLLSKTFPEAKECLGEAIQEGRAYRSRMYDVYLPPHTLSSDSKQQKHVSKNNAILFLPGMGVEHTAYAIPARMLSELGNIVVVVSGEPWRAVTHTWHHNPRSVSRDIMKRVEKRHKTLQWNVVGHSLGGLTATHLVSDLSRSHNVSALAMWAVVPYPDSVDDLSNSTVKVLVIQGSDDAIMRVFATAIEGAEKGVEQFWKRMPSSSSKKEIEGGHSGFASYLSPIPQFQEQTDTSFEQQQNAAMLTHEFFEQASGGGQLQRQF